MLRRKIGKGLKVRGRMHVIGVLERGPKFSDGGV